MTNMLEFAMSKHRAVFKINITRAADEVSIANDYKTSYGKKFRHE